MEKSKPGNAQRLIFRKGRWVSAVFFSCVLVLIRAPFAAYAEEGSGEEQPPVVERVPALDEWEDIEPTETPTPMATATPTPEETEPEFTPPPLQTPPIPGGELLGLNRTQKKRFAQLEKRLREERKKRLEEKRRERLRDPRGAPELRVCSVNLNGYGEKDEVKRLLKDRGAKRLATTERAALKAIREAVCEVVLLQGLAGRSVTYARDALDEFTKKLSRSSKRSWQGRVASSEAQTAFQGVLVSDSPRIVRFEVETLQNFLLAHPGKAAPAQAPEKLSKKDIIPRDILRTTVIVKSDELETSLLGESSQKKARKVVLFNAIVADSLNPFRAELPMLKLQVADGVFRIMRGAQLSSSLEDPPVLMLGVERLESSAGVIEQILSGRLEINDFRRNCSFTQGEEKEDPKAAKPLVQDAQYSCEEKPARPKILFDLLDGTQLPEKAGKPGAPEGPLTAGFYVDERDLPLVRKGGLMKFATGAISLKNGLPGAHLVWVDLNW